jgi:predicted dehydrogenase
VTGVAGRLCKEDTRVEDNAILIMTYPRAMAVAEGSWSQVGHYDAYVPRIYGTRGVLVVSPRKGRTLVMATDKDEEGVQVPVPLVAPEVQNASNHFLYCLESGTPFVTMCNDRVSRDAQEILEAGLLSAVQGRDVSLPLRSSIGQVTSTP